MLQIGLYTSVIGTLYLDASPRASNVILVTGEHGFGTLTCDVRLSIWEAFQLYNQPGLMHVQVTEWGLPVWQGRLEDVRITATGVTLTALGYWRALSDVPYTGFWSKSVTTDFRQTSKVDISNRSPGMYQLDNSNNRLLIGLQKNSVYGNNSDVGSWYWTVPDGGATLIKRVSFNYAFVLPAVNRTMRVSVWNADWSSEVAYNTTLNGSGSGTFTQDVSANPRARVEIGLYNSKGSSDTYASESGANYLSITNLRLTCSGATIYADEISKALAVNVNSVNSGQLSSSGALIGAPAVDLTDQIYQDTYPADILDMLAKLGNSATPPVLFETGVWEKQLLVFQARGATARTWFVDITALELERTINALANSAYAIYQDGSGRTLRTANADNSSSQSQYGVILRRALRTTTTSATQAATQRDAALQDGKDPQPRIAIAFDRVYDGAGALWPLWAPRAWDTLVIRNLPATLSTALDRIRQFRVIETRYDVDQNILTVTPESFQPSLDVLVARRAAGLS